MSATDSSEDDDPEQALREVRGRFTAAFPGQSESIAVLLAEQDVLQDPPRSAALRQLVHRITGLAGTVGFPTVSRRAAELESQLTSPGADLARARDLLAGVREGFAADLLAPPQWAVHSQARRGCLVLVVEDDPDQLAVLELHLRGAGHQTRGVATGSAALEAASLFGPSIVLLDVDLPGMDGYAVCRAMKSTPDLAGIPIMFVTTRASLNERLVGLTLGADDYLCKPVDPRELLLRIDHLKARPARTAAAPAAVAAGPDPGGDLTYEALTTLATAHLAREAIAIALVRTPPAHIAQTTALLIDESRRRDAVARYDASHVLWMLPGMSARAACERARDMAVAARALGIEQVTAGVAAGPAGTRLEQIIAEADEALADARHLDEPAVTKSDQPRAAAAPAAVARSLVLADDDPELTRIVEAHMRSAGFQTLVAFDGDQALAAVEEHRPDVLILDLMMAGANGFEVLRRLQDRAQRPRTVVLSARGREDDVTRAFSLGADDYIVKPFSPQELRARILRLER